MSTIQENLLPSAMVPGLVTIKDKKGRTQNVFPIDAKELIRQGDYELVENGAIEAARMAATPLRSGMASGILAENLIAEVSGIEGRVVASGDPDVAEEAREAADKQADAIGGKALPTGGFTDMRESLATSTGGTAGTEGTVGKTPTPEAKAAAAPKAEVKTEAKASDTK